MQLRCGFRFGLLAALGFLILSGPPARAQTRKEIQPEPPALIQNDNPPPADFIVIDEHIWSSYLADEPGLKSRAAMQDLKDGKLPAAGQNLLKLSALTHMAAARSEPTIRAFLLSDADSLRVLGIELKKERAVSPDRIRGIFARDLQALALHHADRASRHWIKHDGISAGYDLKAAAMDLRDADHWYGANPSRLREGLAVEATELSDKLIDERTVDPKEANRVITEIHERSRELARELHPEGPAAN